MISKAVGADKLAVKYNNSDLKDRRRELRKNQTDVERKLWAKLRNRSFHGLKFFRQYSVGYYILDFYCPTLKLAIELDGGQHGEEENRTYDNLRTNFLNTEGIKVLRFWNNDVMNNIEGVLEEVGLAIPN